MAGSSRGSVMGDRNREGLACAIHWRAKCRFVIDVDHFYKVPSEPFVSTVLSETVTDKETEEADEKGEDH